METKTTFKSLGGEFELSDQLKNFSNLSRKARQEYIIDVFYNKNTAPPFKPIPITRQEAITQKDESKMPRIEILRKVEALLEQMSDNIRQKYYGIESKKRGDLIKILQEVRNLQSAGNNNDNCTENEL
jgi:hypothetical protein